MHLRQQATACLFFRPVCNPKPSGSSCLRSRPPKKNFVEVTELTHLTYANNLIRLRPGHINVLLVFTDSSKNALLSKFAKEVYSFTGWVLGSAPSGSRVSPF